MAEEYNEMERYAEDFEDRIRTIGVLTSGMNAAIRAVVRTALSKGLKVRGIRRGYHGLLREEIIDLSARDVSDTIQRGGTILQTARCKSMRTEEGQQKAAAICKKYGIDGLVVIGGDGSWRTWVSTQWASRERSTWISHVQIIRSDLIQRLTRPWKRSIKCVIRPHLMSGAVL